MSFPVVSVMVPPTYCFMPSLTNMVVLI
jgi:hypothetical protein